MNAIILSICTVIIIILLIGIFMGEGLLYIFKHNDQIYENDYDVSGTEESLKIRNEPVQFEPYTYYLGSNKNKTYKKQVRNRWKEEFDFN